MVFSLRAADPGARSGAIERESERNVAHRFRKRAETESDAEFRFELFCRSRTASEDFSFLDAATRQTLLRQQFAGQNMSYRANFPNARREIIELDDLPIGGITINRGTDAIVIVDIAILPERRGLGIGSSLLREACDAARADGIAVRLSVLSSNDGALRLYRRLGFTPVARSAIRLELEWRAMPPEPSFARRG